MASYSALCASARCVSRSSQDEEEEEKVEEEYQPCQLGFQASPRISEETWQNEKSEESREDVVRQMFTMSGQTITMAVCVGTLSLSIYDVLRNEWVLDDETGKRYLTSQGLAYTTMCIFIAAVVGPWLILDMLCAARDNTQAREVIGPLSEQHVIAILEDADMSCCRAVNVLALVCRVAFNMAMICQRFVTVPPRDPSQSNNQVVHIVVWVELVVSIAMVGSTTFALLMMKLGRVLFLWIWACLLGAWICACINFMMDSSSVHFQGVFIVYVVLQSLTNSFSIAQPDKAAKQLGSAARYSVLNFLGFLTPQALRERWNSWGFDTGLCVKVALLAGRLLFYLPVAVVALQAKVAQTDFVKGRTYGEWSFVEWLNLVALANNILGALDLEKLMQQGIFEQLRWDYQLLDVSTEQVQNTWMRLFGQVLQENYGPAHATLLISTIQADELARLVSSDPSAFQVETGEAGPGTSIKPCDQPPL